MGRNGSLVLPGVARPIRTGTPPDRADAARSLTSRVLPMPASPVSTTSPPPPVGGRLQRAREQAPLDVATDSNRAGNGMHPLILPPWPGGTT